MSKLTIDYSTLALWRLCPQRFIYGNVRNFAQGSTDPLDFGSLIHFGTELLGKAAPTNLPTIEAIDNEIDFLTSGEGPPLPEATEDLLFKVLRYTVCEAAEKRYPLYNAAPETRRSLRHALTLLSRYALHYYPDSIPLIQYESKHSAFLGITKSGHEVTYTGTIDGLLDDAVLERKTTGYIEDYAKKVNPNAQATGYIFLARDLLKQPTLSRVIFDVISTQGFGADKRTKVPNPAKWGIYNEPSKLFLRTETYRTEDQIDRWREQVLFDSDRLIEDVLRAKEGAAVGSDEPNACDAFFSPCPYKHLCQSPAPLRKILEGNTLVKEPWQGFSIQL